MTQLAGCWIGHWTGEGTGVTVVIPPTGTVASGEVRGGAPATREFALLDPSKMVSQVDAVVLSGGSAFGLAAGDGVMKLLHERERGFQTLAGTVPIVVGMSLFDGQLGDAAPGAEQGRLAALAALNDDPLVVGKHGAGTGATSGKWRMQFAPGGFGWAEVEGVTAIAAVNPWGDVIATDGTPLFPSDADPAGTPKPFQNTTLVVIITEAQLSKADCYLIAQSGHDGFARALNPAHTRFDGDATVVLATGASEAEPDLDAIRAAATQAVAAAIRHAALSGAGR
ncbi:P1 family peptidase [Catelliglobosispora koreensis]|uniref:P1 family peptidase n=1 Tax=Catelliglobosispora koreensis TaxID=129052 RepID=UPI0003775614|nr:P1 family peptidase [Catelliglobosispora koreensis]